MQRQQQPQQQQQGYGNQGVFSDEFDSQEEDEDDDDYYQQQQQCQGGSSWDDDNQQQQGEWQYSQYGQQQQQYGQEQYGQQQQRRQQQQQHGQEQYGQQQYGQQQQRRQQQQQHQCSPRFQLLQALEQVNSQLASKLYQQAKQENDDKNTVVSPAALQQALAAIQRGARGNTKRQIQRIIGGGLNQQQTQQAHAALQQSLQGQDPNQQQTGQNQQTQVKTTTTIIVNQQTHTQQQFIQTVKACLNGQVKRCNFQRNPQQCRQQVNRYVAQKTNQKLQQTVPQDAVTTNTKMVVVNTAQLKARWGRQFRQQQTTKQGTFYPLGSQQPKRVQTLQSQGQFNYYEDEQLQVVGVPTQQQELTFYVIVPKDKNGLNQVEKQQIQNGEQLRQLLEQADQQQENVQIELPKFQIKHKLDAKQTLRKQGVQDAFDGDQADFSGIDGQQQQQNQQWQQQQQQQHRRGRQQQFQDDEDENQNQNQNQQWQQEQGQWQQQQNQQQLHVNKLIHQATIQINEQGITAANPNNQGQQQQWQQQQQQWHQQQQQDYQDDDEDQDEQGQQYWQQQWNRQQQMEEIFGQRQNQHHQRRHNRRQGQQGQWQQGQGQQTVRANRAFAFAVKHNGSNQIVLVGRVVDPTQNQQGQQGQQQRGRQQDQSLNGVDQQ
jgi:serpin B